MSDIVIATDGSEAAESAVRMGLELAKQTGDHVVFVSVWELLQGEFGTPLPYVDLTVLEADKARAQSVLDAARKGAAALGIEADSVLAQGEAAGEICRVATERQARMIVIGTHGWGPVRSFLSGSVLSGVLHGAPCAVLAGPRGSRESIGTDEA